MSVDFSHAALVYRGDAELVERVVARARERLDAGGTVLVVLPPAPLRAVRARLGAGAAAADFGTTDDWYASSAETFARWSSFVESKTAGGARHVDIVAAPLTRPISALTAGRLAATESWCNPLLEQMPVSMLCVYDAEHDACGAAHPERTHPVLLRDGIARVNPAYAGAGAPSPVLAGTRPLGAPLAFDRDTLPQLRRHVLAFGRDAGLTARAADDLVAATAEGAANAVEHGDGAGVLRMFANEEEVVCELRGASRAPVPPYVGHRQPALDVERGRGFWLMRLLCAWVDVASADGEVVVRLHQALAAPEKVSSVY